MFDLTQGGLSVGADYASPPLRGFLSIQTASLFGSSTFVQDGVQTWVFRQGPASSEERHRAGRKTKADGKVAAVARMRHEKLAQGILELLDGKMNLLCHVDL
jgi:hypothetical protein